MKKKAFETMTKNERLMAATLVAGGKDEKETAEFLGVTIAAVRKSIEEQHNIVNRAIGADEDVEPVHSSKVLKAIEEADSKIDQIEEKVKEEAKNRKRAKSPSQWKRGERMDVARTLYKRYLDRGEDVLKAVLKEVTGLSTGQCTQYITHLKEHG